MKSHREITNSEIATAFSRVADLLDIQGANPFRVRAYRNVANVLEGTERNIVEMVEHGEPLEEELPGVGRDLAQKVAEIVHKGRLSLLKELERQTPSSLLELLKIPSLGPRRVRALYESLGIKTIEQLKRAVLRGKVHDLNGFGLRTEKKILEAIKRRENRGAARVTYAKAEEIVSRLFSYLEKAPGAKKVTVAGSYRRKKETVGDLDIVITCEKRRQVMNYFLKYPEIREIQAQGPTRSTVILETGLQVDVRVVSARSYGAALYYFTGSKAHTVPVRTMAQRQGLKVNEYGVYKGQERLGGQSEEEVMRLIGLPYIEPELREGRGEIEAAQLGELPHLIELTDIRGDLHAHTDASDGINSLEEMVEGARARGYTYMAITDHSKSLTVARGLDEERCREQIRKIDRINAHLKDFRILKSAEIDILEDGSLDFADDLLKELDIRVCSIHSRFGLSLEKQTERLIRAMDHPYFDILGHGTGRLLGKREPYPVDLERVLLAARERGCMIELNAQPERLDLDDVQCRRAKELGIKIVISSDAHSVASLDFMRFGVYQARRGWLEAKDVLNTRSWAQIKKLLRSR